MDEDITQTFAADLGFNPDQVRVLLHMLADKSLINAHRVHGRTRYTMLESLREYAAEKLSTSPDDKQRTEAAHLAMFASLAQRAEPKLLSTEQTDWIQRLEVDLDNIRIALDRACRNPQHVEMGLTLVNALGWYCSIQKRELEGIRWLERLLMLADANIDATVRAQAHFFLGFLQWYLADYPSAMPNIERGLQLWQALDNGTGLAYANVIHAHIHYVNGQLSNQDCIAAIEISAQVFRETGDDWGLSLALGRLGSTALTAKDYTGAIHYYEEAYIARHRSGLTSMLAGALGNLGFAAMCQHDFDSASRYLEHAKIFAERYNSITALMTTQVNLGHIYFRKGDPTRALHAFTGCLVYFRDQGARDHIIATLASIAYATTGLGTTLRAAILLAAVQHQIKTYGIDLWHIERESFDGAVAKIEQTLDTHTLAEAQDQGRSMTLAQTIEFALAV